MTSVQELEIRPTEIDGLLISTMKQVTDGRGTVREFFRRSAFEAAGLRVGPWVQVNVTETRRGALRGMHGEAMHKLVSVAAGEVFGAYVDARPGSTSYGTVVTERLCPGTQVLVPPGVCNGFQALAEGTQYLYCFDVEWAPDMDGVAICPFDPDLGIAWPLPVDRDDPDLVSAKDRDAPALRDLGGGP